MISVIPTLQAADKPGRWIIKIDESSCVGRLGSQFLFGGMGLALAIRACEMSSGSPIVCAALQFLAPSPIGAVLEIEVKRLGAGRLSQAIIVGEIEGRQVINGYATLGSRADAPTRQWETAPDVPPPAGLIAIQPHDRADHDVHSLLEIRPANGRFGIFSKAPVSGTGHVHAWIRPREGMVDAAVLAVMADFIPSVSSNALAARSGGSSLDNAIRVIRIVPTEWVLCDLVIEAMHGGIGHGRLRLFAQDGTLMATGSQSFAVRILPSRAGY